MDSRSTTPTRNRGGRSAPPAPGYVSHGPWPSVLGTLLFLKLAWCLKLYYSLARGDLSDTPAPKMSTHILMCLGTTVFEVISFPGMQMFAKLHNIPPPHSPFILFAQSFVMAMNNSTCCIFSFIYLHRRLPRELSPDSTGYDPAAAREYRGWRRVDIPLFAMLNMFCAVAIVVNCATWLHWDFERKRMAQRDVELRDLRVRDMFRGGAAERGDGGMETGVVPRPGDERSKGGGA